MSKKDEELFKKYFQENGNDSGESYIGNVIEGLDVKVKDVKKEEEEQRLTRDDPVYTAEKSFLDAYKKSLTYDPERERRRVEDQFKVGADIATFDVGVAQGAVSSVEGVIDILLGIGGGIGGLFDKKNSEKTRQRIEHDFTADLFGRDGEGNGTFKSTWGSDLYKASGIEEGGIIDSIAQGVGGMLPSIAITVASGGAGAGTLGATLGKVASSGVFMGGAAGKSMEQALTEGAGYGNALTYGAIAGGIEGGTELLGGVTFNGDTSWFGRLLAKSKYGNLFSRGIGNAVYTFASEGLEEALSDVLDIFNRQYTGVDKNALANWKDVAKGLPKTILVGGATGVLLNGLQGSMVALKNSNKGGRSYNKVINELQNIENNTKILEAEKQSGKVSNEKLNKDERIINKNILDSVNRISDTVKSLDSDERANLLEDAPFLRTFLNEDGSVIESVATDMQSAIDNGTVTNSTYSALNQRANTETDLRSAEESYKSQTGDETETRIELDNDALSDEERQSFSGTTSAIKTFGKILGRDISVSLVKSNKNINAFVSQRGDSLYVTRSQLQDGSWAKTVSHEVAHFAQGTKEFNALADFLIESADEFASAKENVLSAYTALTEADVDNAFKKVKNGEAMTQNEVLAYEEVSARMVEDIIGNKESVNRLVSRNRNLATKIYNRVKSFLRQFERTNADQETVARMQRAEELFENALKAKKTETERRENAIREYRAKAEKGKATEKDLRNLAREFGIDEETLKRDISAESEQNVSETEETVDKTPQNGYNENNSETRFSINPKKYISYSRIGMPAISYIRNELNKIYSDVDSGIADGIAIANGNTVYIVDSGKENGKVDFGVSKRISIQNENMKIERINKINERAIQNGYVDQRILGKIRRSSNYDSGSRIGRELQEKLSTDNGESGDNKGRISERNADRGLGELKNSDTNFSLQDSTGADNKTPTASNDIRFSLNDVDNYTEKQYNDFGWVRANDVLSANQYNVFTSNYADAKKNRSYFNRTKSGEYMIPVHELYGDREGVDDTIVFARGDIDSPIISRIIKIDLDNETELSQKREEIFENESRGIQTKIEGIFRRYSPLDFKLQYIERNGKSAVENNNESGLYGRRSGSKTSGIERIRFNEDGSQEVTYKDGRKETRFSLNGKPSDTEKNKDYANRNNEKVYSKKDAEELLHDILADADPIVFDRSGRNGLSQEDFMALELKGKSRAEAVAHLQNMLNRVPAGRRAGVATQYADYLIRSVLVKDILDVEANEEDVRRVTTLKQYLHKVNTSGFKDDIKSVFEDKARTVNLLWSSKDGLSMEMIRGELKEAGITLKGDTEAEQFVSLVNAYTDAKNSLQSQSAAYLNSVLGAEDYEKLQNTIRDEILVAYDTKGDSSKLAKLEQKYIEKINALNNKKYSEYVHAIVTLADELKAYGNRDYARTHGIPVSVNMMNDEMFKSLVKTAGNIFASNGFTSTKKIRGNLYALQGFMNLGNQVFKDYVSSIYTSEDAQKQFFEELANSFSALYENFDDGKGEFKSSPLTDAELKAAVNVLQFAKKIYTNYDSYYEEGKRKNLQEKAKQYGTVYDMVLDTKSTGRNSITRGIQNETWKYNAFVSSPNAVASHLDGYAEDGFMTHYVGRFQQDEAYMVKKQVEILSKMNDFLKNNKKYAKRLTKVRIPYNGVSGTQILVGEAIDIYLQATQVNGALTLMDKNGGGFLYTNEKGERLESRPLKFLNGKIDLENLAKVFTEEDRKFMSLLKEIYAECGKLKYETDVARFGFSNLVKGEYYQISRDQNSINRNVGDIRSAYANVQSVNNISANKRRSEKAKKIPLIATNAYTKMMNHVQKMTMYNAFSLDISNFNRIYNRSIDDSGKTVAKELHDIWVGSEKYIKKYLNDIQGVRESEDGSFSKFYKKILSNYAQAQLGFNLKVILSQTASYPTAMRYLDAGSLIKALNAKQLRNGWNDMDKYSVEAYIRNENNEVVRSESVTDKISEFGSVTTKPIQWMDRTTIEVLWNACQYQIAKDGGGAIGSEENKIAAGKLLDQVIILTQPTYQASIRSALQRSENPLARTFAMFTSVPLKQVSMLISSVDKVNALKSQKKKGYAITDEMIKNAKKECARSFGSVFVANMMYAAICQGIKFLFDKDDEEDNKDMNWWQQMLMQLLDTTVSMFPGLKDVYGYFMNGYDIEVMPIGSVNDFLDSVGDLYGVGKSVVTGDIDVQKNAKAIRDGLFSAGMIFGLPVRNVYNTVTGLTRRISPEAAYSLFDSKFTNPTTEDIKKAWNKSGIEYATTAANAVMTERGFDISRKQAKMLAELYKAGYNLPAGTPTKFTVNGEEKNMTKKEQKNFSVIYSKAADAVDEAIENGLFNGIDNSAKASMVNKIYQYYRDMAEHDVLEFEATRNYFFAQAIDPAILAKAVTDINAISERDAALAKAGKKVDRKADITKYVSGLKLTATQKYMLMGYAGYKNSKGAEKVFAYINKMDLTKDEKKRFYKYCGYELDK